MSKKNNKSLEFQNSQNNPDIIQGKIIDVLISNSYSPQKIKILNDNIFDSEFFFNKYYTVAVVMTTKKDFWLEIENNIKSLSNEKNIAVLNSKKNAMSIYIFSNNDSALSSVLAECLTHGLHPDLISNIQLCIGDTVDSLEKIHSSYLNACILNEFSFYTQKGIHEYCKANGLSVEQKSYDIAVFDAESIPCYEDGFKAYLNQTYLSLKESASNPRKSVHILFYNIINHMYMQAQNNGITCDFTIDDMFYMDFLTIDDLYEYSSSFIKEHSLYLPINKVAYKIKNYIKQNYQNKDLSIEMIANNFYMSPQYIPKLFKKAFNISIIQYIANTRISAAKNLIDTQDIGIKNIADEVGYVDANYFSRLFKKKTGMTVTEYKNKHLN